MIPPLARFFSRIEVDEGTGCWMWQGPRAGGYGRLYIFGSPKYVHRLSYHWFNGRIPEGLVIDHLCRVKLCVNPEHLEAVTVSENSRRGPVRGSRWRARALGKHLAEVAS